METYNLCSLIYYYIKQRIRFGVYKKGEKLPTLRSYSVLFQVSLSTVNIAMKKLESDNLIYIPKASRPIVIAEFDEEIQKESLYKFFCKRKEMIIDMKISSTLFFPNLFLEALKLCDEKDFLFLNNCIILTAKISPRYITIFYMYLINKLKNSLIVRLYITIDSFYYPFNMYGFSKEKNKKEIYKMLLNQMQKILLFTKNKKYDDVYKVLYWLYNDYTENYCQKLPVSVNNYEQIKFEWVITKERRQVYTSIAADLFNKIFYENEITGDFLPSAAKLAETYNTSVISIRRTIATLSDIGLVTTINGKGTKINNYQDIKKLINYNNPTLKINLKYYLKVLQILEITINKIILDTFDTTDSNGINEIKEYIKSSLKEEKLYSVYGIIINKIIKYNKNHAIREIYSKLSILMIWGYALRYTDINNNLEQQKINIELLLKAIKSKDIVVFASTCKNLFCNLYCNSKKTMIALKIIEEE